MLLELIEWRHVPCMIVTRTYDIHDRNCVDVSHLDTNQYEHDRDRRDHEL
jgi:hypothetical protein